LHGTYCPNLPLFLPLFTVHPTCNMFKRGLRFGSNVDPTNFAKIAGIITGVYTALQLSCFAWKYYLRCGPRLCLKYSGSWAIVTGGTGGIGLCLAEEFAAAGINLIIIARNKSRLQTVANDLKARFAGVDVRTVSVDAECSNIGEITGAARDLDVSILVNNVGVHNEVPANTEDLPASEIRRIVEVNCSFQVLLTSALIPRLKEYARTRHPNQGKPMVVNISSLTSQMAMPMLSLYAATKAFEEHWTEGLAAELQPAGVEAICLRPGLTVSAMSGETEPSLFCPTARTMAKACVRMLGCGEVSVVPYAPHALLDYINRWVPRQLTWGIVRDMHQKKRTALLEKTK
jgi:17beta-estradiol 17-dehydrogenase / very-long-chain 3-oxoacyl-CoA reductase